MLISGVHLMGAAMLGVSLGRIRFRALPRIREEARGYGATRDTLQATPLTGDGGIDGIITLDRLGLEKVYVQAKRWTKGPVGAPEIQKFLSALAGRRGVHHHLHVHQGGVQLRGPGLGLHRPDGRSAVGCPDNRVRVGVSVQRSIRNEPTPLFATPAHVTAIRNLDLARRSSLSSGIVFSFRGGSKVFGGMKGFVGGSAVVLIAMLGCSDDADTSTKKDGSVSDLTKADTLTSDTEHQFCKKLQACNFMAAGQTVDTCTEALQKAWNLMTSAQKGDCEKATQKCIDMADCTNFANCIATAPTGC